MQRESKKPTWPNPLRTPLLFLAGLIAVYGYHRWVGGTGGLDPARMTEDQRAVTSSIPIHRFFLSYMGFKSFVLLAAGIIAGLIRAGPDATEAGFRYALGSSEPRWMPGAARFFAVAARVTTWGGIFLGIAACAFLEILVYRTFHLHHEMDSDVYSDLFWTAHRWAMYAPLAAIILGRVVFGALADGARVRSGEPDAPVFSRFQDLALFGLFVVSWYLLALPVRDPW